MALTKISDLWTPEIWIRYVREKQATFPSIFTSRAVIPVAELEALASGGGVSGNVPMFKDITDQDDEVQVESTAPANTQGIEAEVQVAPILNRQTKNGASAMSGAVSGSDPIGEITLQLSKRRAKQRQKTLIAILRGVFGTAGARNAAAALSAMRIGGTTAEPFDESGDDANANQKFSPDLFIDLKASFGELADELEDSGLLLLHPNVQAQLERLDKDGFKTGKPSDLPFTITTYRGVPIIKSELLARAGGESGYVYDTYLLGAGVVGYGEKPQLGDVKDVASLQYWHDKDKNDEFVYDRTRFVLHVNGTKWVGTPAGQSATNAELQTAANWQLILQTANRVGVACVRTNR